MPKRTEKPSGAEYLFSAENVTLTLLKGLSPPFLPREGVTRTHVHSVYELFYTREKAIRLYTDLGVCEIPGDSILIVAPNTPHYTDASAVTDYTALHFDAKPVKGRTGKQAFDVLNFARYAVFHGSDEARHLVLMAWTALLDKRGALAGSLLFALLSMLSQTDAAEADGSVVDNTTKRLYRLQEHLYRYDEDTCNLHNLAERLHLSERHLSRIIKKECGTTFRHRLQITRLEMARRLLSEGKPVAEVAALVGYSSLSAFYTAYKRQYGAPPGKERKKKKR